jgi:hypothetical protein
MNCRFDFVLRLRSRNNVKATSLEFLRISF